MFLKAEIFGGRGFFKEVGSSFHRKGRKQCSAPYAVHRKGRKQKRVHLNSKFNMHCCQMHEIGKLNNDLQ